MTSIVAMRDSKNKKLYMGADRSISHGPRLIVMSYSKIYKTDNALIGMSGNSNAIAFIETFLRLPKNLNKKIDSLDIVRNVVLPDIRHTLHDNNMEDDMDVDMLIAWRGDILFVNNLIDCTAICDDYHSIGVFDTAHVVLSVTKGTPKNRIKKTLEACAKEMPGCICGPFDVECISYED